MTTTHTPTPWPCHDCARSCAASEIYCLSCGSERREPTIDPRDATIAELVAALQFMADKCNDPALVAVADAALAKWAP